MIQMELCVGDTLRSYLDKDYIINRKVVFRLFKQLIDGLKHIHEEGLIHRDIKPDNIFIDKDKM
jgi:translation initiation factor 2-alpha kinase 4